MFYSRRKKFSVYKDYFANDVLLSDATFDQPNEDENRAPKRNTDMDEDVDEILTIGDITNVADHIVSTRRSSSVKTLMPNSKPQKVTKLRTSHNTEAKHSTTQKKNKAKTFPARKSTISEERKPIDVEKDDEKIIPMKKIKQHLQIASDPEDLAFIDTKTSVPSIQLSEFQQPPKSTSTPFNNTFIESTPISRNTPFLERPPGYSTPFFHFQAQDDLSNASGLVSNSTSSSFLGLVNNESPLASKGQAEGLRDDIHTITDQIKTQVCIKESFLALDTHEDGDLRIEDANLSLHTQDNKMRTPPSFSNSSITQPPNKSILKNLASLSSTRSRKKVKIDETVHRHPTPTKVFTKRRATDDIGIRSNKKVKLLHKVDSNTSYSDLLALCGEDKDPIDLIIR